MAEAQELDLREGVRDKFLGDNARRVLLSRQRD